MSEYFMTNGFKQDFNNLLKSLLLISKKLEALTDEVRSLRDSHSAGPNKETSTESVTPPTNNVL